MTTDEAEELAGRILAAIDAWDLINIGGATQAVLDADRERVASDLAGLKRHQLIPDLDPGHDLCNLCMPNGYEPAPWPCPDATAYSDGLRRTAAIYGVTVDV